MLITLLGDKEIWTLTIAELRQYRRESGHDSRKDGI